MCLDRQELRIIMVVADDGLHNDTKKEINEKGQPKGVVDIGWT